MKDYTNFADEVYDRGDDFYKAMRDEIFNIIVGDYSDSEAADEIMNLVFSTKYEW